MLMPQNSNQKGFVLKYHGKKVSRKKTPNDGSKDKKACEMSAKESRTKKEYHVKDSAIFFCNEKFTELRFRQQKT